MLKNIFNKFFYYRQYFIYVLLIIMLYMYYLFAFSSKYNGLDAFLFEILNPLLMAQDILDGNFLLKDWVSSTRNFIVKLYTFVLIPLSIFGVSYDFFYYYPPFIMVLIMLGAYLLVYRDSGNRKISFFNIFILVCLLFIPSTYIKSRIMLFSYHNEIYAVILFFLFFLDRYSYTKENRKISYPIVLFLLAFIATSDPYVIFIFVIPLMILLVYRLLFFDVDRKKEIIVLLILVLATFCSKVLEKVLTILGGTTYSHVPSSFINIENIGERILISIKHLLTVTGSNFFGLPVNDAIFQLLSFIILMIILGVLVYVFINFKNYNIVTQFLALSPVFIMSVNTLSKDLISESDLSARYYIMIAIYLIILTARVGVISIITDKLSYKGIKHKLIQIGIIIIIGVVALHNMEEPVKKVNIKEPVIVSFLKDKKLMSGYASSYFDANFIRLYSNNEIHTKSFHRLWLSKGDWYTESVNFIVTREESLEYFKNNVPGYTQINKVSNSPYYVIEYPYDISYHRVYLCNNCDRDKNNIILNINGVQYGPYLTLDKGKYKITITGENLDKVTFDTCSGSGNKKYELYDVKVENNLIEYYFKLHERTTNIEHRIFNNQELPVTIKSIVREKLQY